MHPRSKHYRRARRYVIVALCMFAANLFTALPAAAATRDIRIHLTNRSDVELKFKSYTLDHGCWVTEPPKTIAVDQTADIASASCGVATGTEFTVKYWVGDSGLDMTMHYDNPFAGSDDFDEDAAEAYDFESSGVIEDRTAIYKCEGPCDGIPSDWKKNGATIDPGGGNPPQFVDLPKMGVSLDRPNLLVQLDWMQDATRNQQLGQAGIDTIVRAFDQSPVTYRGATRPGVTLIVDAGPTSTITPGGAQWGSLSRAKQITWTQDLLTKSGDEYVLDAFYGLLRSNLVPTGRLPIFRYAVAAAGLSPGDATSGLTPGDKLGFMVSLGQQCDADPCWTGTAGSQNEQVGTFMHELGHVLTLDHSGGAGDGDAVNRAPNYPSVMSYAHQTRGLFRGGVQVFDYSRDNMTGVDVDETTLKENDGVNLGPNPSGYGTTHSCLIPDAAGVVSLNTFVQATLSPVDWNCDTSSPNGGTGFDSNGDNAQMTLRGATSDWSRIKFKTGAVGRGSAAKDLVTVPGAGATARHRDLTAQQARRIRVLPLSTMLANTGATESDYHDGVVVSARLTDPGADVPSVVGKTVSFSLGSDTCSGTTNASGSASCTLNVTQTPGTHTLTVSFGGDTMYRAASTNASFTVTREETTLTFTGPTVVLAGSSSTALSATITEDGANDNEPGGVVAPPNPAGQAIIFTLGAQSCTGIADAAGTATCVLPGVSSGLGESTISASFAGDTYYEPSSDSDEVIVFAFPSSGVFVIGDQSAQAAGTTGPVTWWSDSWYLRNALSGGIAPESFKGFGAIVSTLPTATPANVCGQSFTTRGGNSPPPVADIPEYMGVVVASSVTKKGSTINGTWSGIVVVKPDGTYAPSPGHPGTGTIIATFC